MFNFSATDNQGNDLKWKRVGVDGISVRLKNDSTSLDINYTLLAKELSVRSNHLDTTHLHLMPPFTWFWPERGVDMERLKLTHHVELTAPSTWTPATQLQLDKSVDYGQHTKRWQFSTTGRDMLLDSIMEVNPNPAFTHDIDGRVHHLKWWDSGGHQPNEKRLETFVDDMVRIAKEHHALFGVPDWPDYTTVLHLTDTGRGGLEHMNSQTSMMPRSCLFPDHPDEYRDLVSLFSHEYLHQWNVKRLRPKSFINYDLQSETHTDLLWWFEGATSWLGDMICVRSGAWTEEDWRLDFERKMKRHTANNGMLRESLAESSHDAWIHLYRSGPYTRESQISYYLEGELALLCLDTELRRRNDDTFGACDLMAELVRRYAISSDEAEQLGVDYSDIRKTLKSCPGGSSMGPYLDRLVQQRNHPNVQRALSSFRLKLVPHASDKEGKGWLGVNLRDSSGRVTITTYQAGSPLRNITQVGDEVISVDGVRIKSVAHLKKLIGGRAGEEINLDITHEGILTTTTLVLPTSPQHGVTLKGKGNQRWKAWITTRQAK
jgi:predicted metalloprotease with PDZ domain